MTYLDVLFDKASDAIGTPPDQLKVIAMMVSSIPLAALMPHFPANSSLTHIYSIVLSYLFHTQVLHLQSGYLEILGQTIGTWLAVKYCRATNKRKSWYWAIFLANMAVLTKSHLARWFNNIPLDIIEISGSQMVLVMKLTLFAWNAYDGGKPVAQLDRIQARDRLVQLPGLLPFLGYCFFFPSVLAGPNFPYAAYAAFVDRSLFATAAKENSLGMPRGRWRKAGKRTAVAAFYLAVYALLAGKFSYYRILEPSFSKHRYGYLFVFVQIAGFIARTKYYAVWSFCEAGMITSGMGWDPEVKKYNRGRNVIIRQIEFAQSYKVLLDAWNCGTNYWLRECVYKRLAKRGRKPGFKSTLATFVNSAFWHGINPTYYFTFVLGAFLQALGRKVRANIRPFVLPPDYQILSEARQREAEKTLRKYIYNAISIFFVQITLNFAVIPFLMLEVQPTLQVWKQLRFYGLWLIIVPMVAFQLGLQKYLKAALKKRARKAGVTEEAVAKIRTDANKFHNNGVNFAPDAATLAEKELKSK